MTRLTTPRQEFQFDTDPSDFARIQITYNQDGNNILVKEKNDLTIEQTEDGTWTASFTMTQEETALFDPDGDVVRCQTRILTTQGEALASDIATIKVKDVLNQEVLT